MTHPSPIPTDPDLRGVPDALRRAADKARRLAEQTGTPFIVRQATDAVLRDAEAHACSEDTSL